MPTAIEIEQLAHSYGAHQALEDVGFTVGEGEVFGLLGPNGGGKTTLFRILSTLLPVQRGSARVLGIDLGSRAHEVRANIGVTFQSPSLDGRLTVRENLKHQGHLYGLYGRELGVRIGALLDRLGLSDRAGDRVDSLSGGLKRRVEIAKGLLHEPLLLLLDEPSTGLDPAARHDVWRYLRRLRDDGGVTVLVTTHLMEEAERCDRLGILDRGRLVALDTPEELRTSLEGDCLTLSARDPAALAESIQERFDIEPLLIGEQLRIERQQGTGLLRDLIEAFPEQITSIALAKPTLEDVFIQRTGHRFWDDA